MAPPVCCFNGEWIERSQASLSIDDRGFLFGDCLYDVISCWKGSIYRLDDHLDRFFASITATGMANPMPREEWREKIVDCVRRNELEDASVRVMITRGLPAPPKGPAPDYMGLRTFVPDYRATTIITAGPYYYLAEQKARKEGIRLWISHLRAFPPDTLDPRYKSQSRLHFQLARMEAMAAGCDDAIWLDQHGYLAEGPASNIFLVVKGELYTPRGHILRGITRMAILEIADALGIGAHERDLTAYDLYSADEAFTSSTGGGILPIREVDGRTYPAPAPGPITKQLDGEYWSRRQAGEHGVAVFESAKKNAGGPKAAGSRHRSGVA